MTGLFLAGSKHDDIIFPDVQTTKNPINPETFSAKGKGTNCVEDVCSDAKDYPYEYIEQLVNRESQYNDLFGYLEGTIVNTPTRWQPGQEPESETLCGTAVHTSYPKTLKNENGTERFIVNVEGHKQGLVYETCL